MKGRAYFFNVFLYMTFSIYLMMAGWYNQIGQNIKGISGVFVALLFLGVICGVINKIDKNNRISFILRVIFFVLAAGCYGFFWSGYTYIDFASFLLELVFIWLVIHAILMNKRYEWICVCLSYLFVVAFRVLHTFNESFSGVYSLFFLGSLLVFIILYRTKKRIASIVILCICLCLIGILFVQLYDSIRQIGWKECLNQMFGQFESSWLLNKNGMNGMVVSFVFICGLISASFLWKRKKNYFIFPVMFINAAMILSMTDFSRIFKFSSLIGVMAILASGFFCYLFGFAVPKLKIKDVVIKKEVKNEIETKDEVKNNIEEPIGTIQTVPEEVVTGDSKSIVKNVIIKPNFIIEEYNYDSRTKTIVNKSEITKENHLEEFHVDTEISSFYLKRKKIASKKKNE